MESLPRLSGDRALSSDMLCRNNEEPECGGGCYPMQAPGTSRLAKSSGVQGGHAVPRRAQRSRVSGCNGYYKFVFGAGAKQKP
jgi:hypothetical protein